MRPEPPTNPPWQEHEQQQHEQQQHEQQRDRRRQARRDLPTDAHTGQRSESRDEREDPDTVGPNAVGLDAVGLDVAPPPRWYTDDTTPRSRPTSTGTSARRPGPYIRTSETGDNAGDNAEDNAGDGTGDDTAKDGVYGGGDRVENGARVHHGLGPEADHVTGHTAGHGTAARRGDQAIGGEDGAAERGGEDGSVAWGPDPSVGEIARAARSALLSTDVLQSGPALWPFGHRARQRRTRNRQVMQEARRRRAQFREAFDAHTRAPSAPSQVSTSPTPRTSRSADPTPDAPPHQPSPPGSGAAQRPSEPNAGWRRVDRRTNTAVIAGLAGAVLIVVLILVWRGEPNTAATPSAGESLPVEPTTLAPTSSPGASSRSGSATSASGATGETSQGPRLPIPTGGVEPIRPHPAGPQDAPDPRSVRVVDPPVGDPTPAELSSPEAAMRAWLARWCPFTFTDAFGAAERRARPAMTDAGWATVNPHRDHPSAGRARASWEKTVAARESGRCATPAATVSPEAPRSASSAIVVGAVTRVVTAHAATDPPAGPAVGVSYVEQVAAVRIVRRGTDGLWRVDLATAGG